MAIQQLDYLFPFVVFGYGAIMTFVLSHPALIRLAQERLPEQLANQFKAHRFLGLICLFIGGIWSLQNLWLN